MQTETNREELIKQMDELHDAAWKENDTVKRIEIEMQFNRLRAQLNEIDRKGQK